MDALEFFALRYDTAHTSMTDQLLEGLTDEQLRARPHGVNSIAWLLWHIARCEDVGVNRLVADRPQLIDAEPWLARLNAPRRDIGTGMTSDEVTDLSERVDLAALRAYWDALYRRTLAIVRENPVRSSRTTISTCGIAAPFGSRIVPDRLPLVPVCAAMALDTPIPQSTTTARSKSPVGLRVSRRMSIRISRPRTLADTPTRALLENDGWH